MFIISYYVDLQTIPLDKDAARVKELGFYINKAICAIIQLGFFCYELIQIRNEGSEYFEDFWNYFEVLGMILFFWAAYLDVTLTHVNHTMRILFSCSIMMCLVKVVYLIRVFKQLNFLVTMLITVCNSIIYFMVLFFIFLLTFAECSHLL